MKRQWMAAVSVAVTLLCVATAWAQPLADRVPADAIVYIGWQGERAMGPGYANTHFKALLDLTNIPGLMDKAVEMGKAQGQMSEQEEQEFNTFRQLAAVAWKHPWALYFGGIKFPGQAGADGEVEPVPLAALIIDAGPEAKAVAEQINAALAKDPETAKNLQAHLVANFVVLGQLSAPKELTAVWAGLTGKSPTPLSADAGFKTAMAGLPKSPVAAILVDFKRLGALIQEGVKAEEGEEEAARFVRGWNAMGMENVGRLAYAGGFEGADWRGGMTLEAPAPRKGIFRMIDGEGMELAALKAVPAGAAWASGSVFDVGRMLDEIREIAKAMDPNAVQQINDGLQSASAMAGFDIEADLLRAFGPHWIVYGDPMAGGFMGLNVTVVNRLSDAAKMKKTLEVVKQQVNAMLAGQAGAGGGPAMQVQSMEQDGLAIDFVPMMMVSPAWTVHENHLVISLLPQATQTAVDQIRKPQAALTENDKFTALMQKVGGPAKVTGVTYVDLTQTVPQMYQMIMMVSQMMAAQGGNADLATMLPPQAKITPHLAPAGMVSWTDGKGVHVRSYGPFPGAVMASPGGMLGPLGAAGAAAATAGNVHRPAVMDEMTEEEGATEEAVPPAGPPPAPRR